MQRPDFDSIKDFSEFLKYYWYREELIKRKRFQHQVHQMELLGWKLVEIKDDGWYFQGI